MSINAATDDASCPLDWRLFIPKEWDEDSEWNQERPEKTKLPEDLHHVEKWRLALEMIDELRGWGIKPRRLDSVEVKHPNVHQDDVGVVLGLLASFLATKDGREDTQFGMERIVHITP